ncbi:MAG: permease [Bryobacterales bacterium]|nr:permease [Bryobacteraceae bacterium]MDW8131321.1 permease [Bryobacterales bacterium]
MIGELALAGLKALEDYVATHVLTCLVPAFLLAGGIVAFVRREMILEHLGEQASKWKSFPLAAGASFFVAACSCTVIPVASGLYYGGAGIGAAFIVLWVAPATNVLALVYTGSVLGAAMVVSRIAAALLVALAVGAVMSAAFRQEASQPGAAAAQSAGGPVIARERMVLLGLVLVSLLAPNYVVRTGAYLYKVLVWAALMAVVAVYALRTTPRAEIGAWLRETWWFVRIIFPLLLAGVFVVGVIGRLLPAEWIRVWLGGGSLRASFLATLIGAVSYFATMTEAPFVDTLMKLGMGPGPALALLLTGPGLSLPNWLAIARVFGMRKAAVYVGTILVLGTVVGWFFGNFVLTR